MSIRNYYAVLGVTKTATRDQLVDSFRALAMKYHPDRNSAPNAKERFMEVYEAYEILIDQDKRAGYDQLLANQEAAFAFSSVRNPDQPISESESATYSKWSEDARSRAEQYSGMRFGEFFNKVIKAAVAVVGTVVVSAAVGVGVGVLSAGLQFLFGLSMILPIITLFAAYSIGAIWFVVCLLLACGWYAYLTSRYRAVKGDATAAGSGAREAVRRSMGPVVVGLAVYSIIAIGTVSGMFNKLGAESKKRQETYEESIADLRTNFAKYIKQYPSAKHLKKVAFSKNIVIIDMQKKDFHLSFYRLPRGLGAKKDVEIEQLVQVTSRQKVVGKYTDMKDAIQLICDYSVIDYKQGKVVFKETLYGSSRLLHFDFELRHTKSRTFREGFMQLHRGCCIASGMQATPN